MFANAGKHFFESHPFIGCPFDASGMRMVEEWRGFKVGMQAEFSGLGSSQNRGTIVAIGENAKYLDGAVFTAFAVQVGQRIHIKTHREIWHVLDAEIDAEDVVIIPRASLPELWVEALRKGWKVTLCSCHCGGRYIWMEPAPRPSMGHLQFGCVCHNDPKP